LLDSRIRDRRFPYFGGKLFDPHSQTGQRSLEVCSIVPQEVPSFHRISHEMCPVGGRLPSDSRRNDAEWWGLLYTFSANAFTGTGYSSKVGLGQDIARIGMAVMAPFGVFY
jgi:hypothetical protein